LYGKIGKNAKNGELDTPQLRNHTSEKKVRDLGTPWSFDYKAE